MRLKLALTALLAAANAFAGEYAILNNGFSMRIDRHEASGPDAVRLYTNGGFMDLPAASILRFEPEAAPRATQKSAAKETVPAKQLVTEAAHRWGLPPEFLHSLVKAESGYQTNAVSAKGAIGLMQLMPETARELGADPNDPRQNVEAGARYISNLLRKYLNDDHQVRKAVAAYNAGPGAVDRYQGVPPYRETTAYVERVLRQAGISAPRAK
ncbi:MAG: lytic transglycosylase domain-containing protein [Acidobacteriota bacterium]